MKNTKIARRAVTMVLVLSMLLCILPAASAATTATITENGSTTVDLLMGDTCTLTYTPDTTGTHLFYFEHQVDEHTWDMIDFSAPRINGQDVGGFTRYAVGNYRGAFFDLAAGTTYTFELMNPTDHDMLQKALHCTMAQDLDNVSWAEEPTGGIAGYNNTAILNLEPFASIKETITWTSSNPSVATVEENEYGAAQIKYLSAGTTTITAAFSGGKSISKEIKVVERTSYTIGDTLSCTIVDLHDNGERMQFLKVTPAASGSYAFTISNPPSQEDPNWTMPMECAVEVFEIMSDGREEPVGWYDPFPEDPRVILSMTAGTTYYIQIHYHSEPEAGATITSQAVPSVTGVEITKVPDKTTYLANTEPNPRVVLSTIGLTATFSDGTTETYNTQQNSGMLNGYPVEVSFPAPGSDQVTVTVGGCSDTFPATILNKAITKVEVIDDTDAFLIENVEGYLDPDTGAFYYHNLSPVMDNLTFKATFDDNTSETFTVSDEPYAIPLGAWMDSQYTTPWTVGGTNPITLEFGMYFFQYNVKIIEKPFVSMTVEGGSWAGYGGEDWGHFEADGSYVLDYIGIAEAFADMVITGTKADGTTVTITMEDMTWPEGEDGSPFYMGQGMWLNIVAEDFGVFTEPVSTHKMYLDYLDMRADFTWTMTCAHKMTETAAVSATCTSDGNAAYYTCSVCDKVYADAEGKTETTAEKQVIKGGHKLTEVKAQDATYTAAGNTAYYTCSGCTKLFADAAGKTETTLAAVTVPQLIKVEDTSASVSTGAVDNAISNAASTGNVVLDLNEVAAGSTSGSEKPAAVTSAQLPVASLEQVAKIDEEATLTVSMADATVVLDAATLTAVADQADGATVTLEVKQVKAETLNDAQQEAIEDLDVHGTISASLLSGGKYIHDFDGGKATVAVPFALPVGVKGEDIVVIYVADDGKTEEVPTTFANNVLMFTVEHFSEYVIVNTAAEAPTTNGSPATGDVGILNSVAAMLLSGMGVIALVPKKRQEV